MLRRILVIAALVTGLFATSAGAQYQGLCGIIVDPPVVNPGGTISISGQGAVPGSTVTARLGDQVLGTAVASTDPDGTFFFASLVIPNTTAPGDYTISVTAEDGFQEECGGTSALSNTLTVEVPPRPAATGAGAGAGAGSLPVTGGDPLPLATVAAVLVAGGGLLVLSSRKKREGVAA